MFLWLALWSQYVSPVKESKFGHVLFAYQLLMDHKVLDFWTAFPLSKVVFNILVKKQKKQKKKQTKHEVRI